MRPQYKKRSEYRQSPITGMFDYVQPNIVYFLRLILSYVRATVWEGGLLLLA